jgi:hypothetical protein
MEHKLSSIPATFYSCLYISRFSLHRSPQNSKLNFTQINQAMWPVQTEIHLSCYVQYHYHELIFVQPKPTEQRFVNNPYVEIHKKPTHCLGVHKGSQTDRQNRHGLHIMAFFILLTKECITTVTDHD